MTTSGRQSARSEDGYIAVVSSPSDADRRVYAESVGGRPLRLVPDDQWRDVRDAAVIVVSEGVPDAATYVARIRSVSNAPLVVLSDRDSSEFRARLHEKGADAVLPADTDLHELGAAVRALLSRSPAGHVRRVGGISVDEDARLVTVHGEPVVLTSTEFNLLAELARNANRLVETAELTRVVSSPPGALRVHVSNVRRKLGPAGPQLETVRGVGYALRSSPADSRPPARVVRAVMDALGVAIDGESIDPEALAALLELRRDLAVRSMEAMCFKLSPADIALLRSAVDRLSAKADDPARFFAIECTGYYLAVRVTRAPVLAVVLREVQQMMPLSPWLQRSTRQNAALAIDTYTRVVDMLADPDSFSRERAEALLRELDRHIVASARESAAREQTS